MRPALLGWLLITYGVVATLLAMYSGIETRRARRVTAHAQVVLDSLSRGRWVRLDSGDVVIRKRVGR